MEFGANQFFNNINDLQLHCAVKVTNNTLKSECTKSQQENMSKSKALGQIYSTRQIIVMMQLQNELLTVCCSVCYSYINKSNFICDTQYNMQRHACVRTANRLQTWPHYSNQFTSVITVILS